jgi:ABC-type antimicrobial peptide transport system permease subunit
MADLMSGNYTPKENEPFTYEEILGLRFKLLTTADFFAKTDKTYKVDGSDEEYAVWRDLREGFDFNNASFVTENGTELKISGIIRPHDGAAATSIAGAIGYTKALTDYILEKNASSEVINQQKATEGVNVLTGLPFERTVYTRENIGELINKIDAATMDMFYAYMTNFIRSSEDTASLLNVSRSNINTMFMLLSDEMQAEVLAKIVASAVETNPGGTEQVFNTISSMTGGITVTKDNIALLIPILNKMETMPLLIALGVPGTLGLADSETVDAVIADINEKHPEFAASPLGAVTAKNLSMIMSRLPADEQKAIYETVIGSINEANDTMLTLLCSILSAQLQDEFTKENLAEKLSALPAEQAMMGNYLALGGVPGFADYADAETMNEVYSDMNELMLELEVNEKIFSLLLFAMPDDKFSEMEAQLYSMAPQIDATYESVLKVLDDAEKASPASINFYAKDFESKEKIESFIKDYNDAAKADGRDRDVIQYTDVVGTLMSSVTVIVNAISYVLIAFVSISLVVSSIMIGIITNISVLERIKEIGILRAIGASKKDVSRVFNAETLIIGLASGAFGIILTLLLCIPITAIVQYFTGLDSIRAILPWQGAVALVIISMILTLIAGIIPSRSAAKKDPVVALRSE